MKKILASILCMTLLVTLFPSISYANDIVDETVEYKYTNEEVLDLACNIWPEHEEILRNQKAKPASKVRSLEEDVVVLQKTHKLSENETIMYVEKASGMAFALVVENWVQSSQTSGSGYVEYGGSLYATCGTSASNLINFRYRIYTSDFDRITNYGIFDNTKVNVNEHGRRTIETATDPAYYTYQVDFVDDLGWIYGSTIINFRIQNNEFYCSAN